MENRHELVFPNRRGEQWSESGWSNWRRRVWGPINYELGISHTPYALRHLYVSLLIREGLPLTVVASYAGHSVAMCLKTYAHLIVDEASGSAEGEIRKARAIVAEQRETA